MIGVVIRTLLFNVRVASCASRKWTNPNYASGAYRRSAVAAVHAVRLTVAARGARVGEAPTRRCVGLASGTCAPSPLSTRRNGKPPWPQAVLSLPREALSVETSLPLITRSAAVSILAPEHTAQREAAMAAIRSFVAT